MGPCPASLGEQSARPMGRNSHTQRYGQRVPGEGQGKNTAWRTLVALRLRNVKCLHSKKGAPKRRPQVKTKDAARVTI